MLKRELSESVKPKPCLSLLNSTSFESGGTYRVGQWHHLEIEADEHGDEPVYRSQVRQVCQQERQGEGSHWIIEKRHVAHQLSLVA